ncbi:WYL domain-containing protein [Persicimonas caeni]|uniref:WYL domain-containing protein n=1 Tax=Persicimonas caeni TaxID=2292766 RepID=A0A4Y6PPA0_PERCE|nr:WYL domain-containing protein [Persicimonas caeni]QDG50033.1 WYL domain-containing protein [Persicimonas caeni]QED31254.1 WYL domain-containing protein [Persicimonas caeni]
MSARNTFAATRRSHAILQWLQNGEEVTIQRVIDNFDIKYPQAREDLKLLEELYGLSTHRDGRVKVWTWAGFDPDYVSVATAAALELGSIALDLFRETPYRSEIERLAEHCRNRVGDKQRQRLDRVSQALHLRRTWLPADEEAMVDHVESILDAVFKGRRLAMVYARADGEVRHYVVTPRKMVWYAGRLWLLARHEEQMKLFDVAGIDNLEEVPAPKNDGGEPITAEEMPASDEELAKYFENAFGIYAQNYPVAEIELEVSGAWANYLRRYRVHPSQQTEEGYKSLRVSFHMGLCPEFKSFVLGMLPNVKVHAPAELAEELEETVQMWLEEEAPL